MKYYGQKIWADYNLVITFFINLWMKLLLFHQQEIFWQQHEANTHKRNSKTHVLVRSFRYIPRKFLMLFPGEMHETEWHDPFLSHGTTAMTVVEGFRTCLVMTGIYWLEHLIRKTVAKNTKLIWSFKTYPLLSIHQVTSQWNQSLWLLTKNLRSRNSPERLIMLMIFFNYVQ